MPSSRSADERSDLILVKCLSWTKLDGTTRVTSASKDNCESKGTPRLWASFLKHYERLHKRLLMLMLGPEGVINLFLMSIQLHSAQLHTESSFGCLLFQSLKQCKVKIDSSITPLAVWRSHLHYRA